MSAVFEVITESMREAQQMLPRGLSEEQREQVIVLTQQIRFSATHAAMHMANTGRFVLILHEVIEDAGAFEQYCQAAFNFSRASVYRYLKAGRAVKAHFSDGDGMVSPLVKNINFDVLQLLGADTDPRVIDNIKLLAAEKGEVNGADAQALIDQATAELQRQLVDQSDTIIDLKATLANTEAQLTESRREHRDEAARADRNELQLRNRERAFSDLEGTLDAHRKDIATAEATIKDLQSKPAEAQYEKQTVQVLPEGYTTEEEAIAAIQSQRAGLEKETEQLTGEVAARRSELETVGALLAATRRAAGTADKLRQDIEQITRQIPQAVSEAVAASPNARQQVDELASKLRALAEVLSPLGGRHA
jgi:hypothetical protein